MSSNVTWTNMDIKKSAGGPQGWAKGPPLIIQTVQNLGVVMKMKLAQ